MKPKSIERFDIFYFAALAASAVGFFVGYDDVLAQMRAQTAGTGFSMGGGFITGSFIVGLLISLLLWFFVSKKASPIAKWILVVFFALGLIGIPRMFAEPLTIATVFQLIGYALQGVAIWYLFQPDTKAWFDGETPPGADTFE